MSAPSKVVIGDRAPTRTFGPITRTDIVRYQGASGDFNPIHHDDDFAQGAGYPTVFSVGMLQAGLLATFVTDWLGPVHVRRFAVQFKEQVWPGDVLSCAGTVTAVRSTDDETIADVELSCTGPTGTVVIAGEASFVVAP